MTPMLVVLALELVWAVRFRSYHFEAVNFQFFFRGHHEVLQQVFLQKYRATPLLRGLRGLGWGWWHRGWEKTKLGCVILIFAGTRARAVEDCFLLRPVVYHSDSPATARRMLVQVHQAHRTPVKATARGRVETTWPGLKNYCAVHFLLQLVTSCHTTYGGDTFVLKVMVMWSSLSQVGHGRSVHVPLDWGSVTKSHEISVKLPKFVQETFHHPIGPREFFYQSLRLRRWGGDTPVSSVLLWEFKLPNCLRAAWQNG